jgi:thiamine-monophosphate kinase
MVAAAPASLGEFGRIRRYFAPLASGAPGALGLTDDAALIDLPPGERLVVTADAIVEGVHFLPFDPPDRIARKLLRVNLSDLAAMGAVPAWYVLTMAVPARCDDAWVEAFARGLALDQAEFGIHLLGGDSVSTPGPITLSVTAFGRVAAGAEIRRSGARPGDLVFLSGTVGDGALGLLAATGQLSDLMPEERRFLVERYQLPRPRVTLGPALAGLAHAMMDVSDGLAADLGHVAAASGSGAVLESWRVPLSAAAAAALAQAPDLLETVLSGGDDYELLFTAPAEAGAAIMAAALTAGVPVTMIGRVVEGEGVVVLDRDGAALPLARTGFRHA